MRTVVERRGRIGWHFGQLFGFGAGGCYLGVRVLGWGLGLRVQGFGYVEAPVRSDAKLRRVKERNRSRGGEGRGWQPRRGFWVGVGSFGFSEGPLFIYIYICTSS